MFGKHALLSRKKEASSRRILIVESDISIAYFLQQALSDETPHHTACVTTATEALELTRSLKPDLLLLNRHLVDGNGIKLYDQLQARRDLKDTPVILLSTTQKYDEDEIGSRDLIGLDLPIDIDELLQTVEKCFDLPC